jgi:hypothetical protein
MDLHIGTTSINSSALQEFHVARRELERKFEIILLEENARMELKSSAKENVKADLPIPVCLNPIRAAVKDRWRVKDIVACRPPGHGRKIRKHQEAITPQLT